MSTPTKHPAGSRYLPHLLPAPLHLSGVTAPAAQSTPTRSAPKVSSENK